MIVIEIGAQLQQEQYNSMDNKCALSLISNDKE